MVGLQRENNFLKKKPKTVFESAFLLVNVKQCISRAEIRILEGHQWFTIQQVDQLALACKEVWERLLDCHKWSFGLHRFHTDRPHWSSTVRTNRNLHTSSMSDDFKVWTVLDCKFTNFAWLAANEAGTLWNCVCVKIHITILNQIDLLVSCSFLVSELLKWRLA